MKSKYTKCLAVLAALVVGLGSAQLSRATLVHSGWDLFITQGSTSFDGMNWQGVPLNTYDFGSGVQNVGSTDTIMQRVNNVPDIGGSTALSLVALQLESIDNPALYLTLQSIHGGTASTGLATINPDWTFTSFFDVYFDIRLGGLDGDILGSGSLHMTTASDNHWSHDAPSFVPDSLKIAGVNYMLDGSDTLQDFWPVGEIVHDASGAAHHVVLPVPEPTTMVAGVLLLLPFGASTLRMLRRRQMA